MNVRLPYLILLLICVSILAVGATSMAWSVKRDLKGPILTSALPLKSDDIAATVMLDRLGRNVVIRDNKGKEMWTYAAKKTLNAAALSGDGLWIATVGGGVRLLSVAEKKEIWAWEKDGRNAVAITPHGGWIAAGGTGAKAYLFRTTSATPVKTWALDRRDDSPKSIAISDDGKTIAVAGNLYVYLLNGENGAVTWKAAPARERVNEVRISNDGKYVLGISAHMVRVWENASAKPVWEKSWSGSLIGAAMTMNGTKVVVSHKKGVTVFDIRGKELRSFNNEFGNSDVAISANGKYIYVNSGSRRLYAFDDSYSKTKLRPFRIIRDINAGGHRSDVVTDALGSVMTYPKGDSIYVEESKPAVLAISPDIPLIIKDQTLDMSAFVTNPGIANRRLSLRVNLSLPASLDWWKNLTGKMSDKEPNDIRSKLIEYTLDELEQTSADVYEDENLSVDAGSSIETNISFDVPDLASGAVFDEYLGGAMNTINPISLVSTVLSKIKGPLSKLIGKDAANIAIVSASRTISAVTGQMIFPTLGMGTVTIYDENGNALDRDSFYFMYLR